MAEFCRKLNIRKFALIFLPLFATVVGFRFGKFRRYCTSLTLSDERGNKGEDGYLNSNGRPLIPHGFEAQSPVWASGNTDSAIIPIGPDIESDKSSIKKSPILSKSLVDASPNAMRYFNIMENITPNDLLLKFAQNAPKNVQEATKSTVMNLLGSLPNYALDAALLTTNLKLANLLYQMQITGYMFKSAEYRMSLTRSLKGMPKLPSSAKIKKGNYTISPMQQLNEINGNVSIKTASGETVTMSVQDLTKALGNEVNELRRELATIKDERESELKANLLTYVQALPEKELGKLTSDMSSDVLQAIQLLIGAVMEKIGVDIGGPEQMIQQSVGNLAQLCMWQMALGYRLREMEALDRGIPMD